ncbi:hypothetical protein BX666DRAFT_2118006 [Dichotomocladium elegans]|nr:hypothetical protein BX666DRAFT_2118006 [Dichotomocladium elegans]
MDLYDPIWSSYMTEDELHEIKHFKRPTISPLPEDLVVLFETYEGKSTWLCHSNHKLLKLVEYPVYIEHWSKQLLSILHIIWHARSVMLAALKALKSNRSYANRSFASAPCFTPRTISKVIKQRKTAE